MPLHDKVAVVTGAAVGTGRAIAGRLATECAAVVLADVDAEGLAQTSAMVEAAGGRAAVVVADVRREADVAAIVGAAVSGFGGLDVLVNNAGGGGHIPPHFPEATPAQWGALLDLNLPRPDAGHPARDPRAAPPRRGRRRQRRVHRGPRPPRLPVAGVRRGQGGAHPVHHVAGGSPRPAGVRVTCVVPDWVATERAQGELAAMTPEQRAAAPRPIPLSDLADAVVRLVRDDGLDGAVLVLRPGREAELLEPRGQGVP